MVRLTTPSSKLMSPPGSLPRQGPSRRTHPSAAGVIELSTAGQRRRGVYPNYIAAGGMNGQTLECRDRLSRVSKPRLANPGGIGDPRRSHRRLVTGKSGFGNWPSAVVRVGAQGLVPYNKSRTVAPFLNLVWEEGHASMERQQTYSEWFLGLAERGPFQLAVLDPVRIPRSDRGCLLLGQPNRDAVGADREVIALQAAGAVRNAPAAY